MIDYSKVSEDSIDTILINISMCIAKKGNTNITYLKNGNNLAYVKNMKNLTILEAIYNALYYYKTTLGQDYPFVCFTEDEANQLYRMAIDICEFCPNY